MSAGWALLVRDAAVSSKWDRAALTDCGLPVTTVTTDPRTGLLLATSGQCAGLVVASYELLSPMVVELDQQARPRALPGSPGEQRPQIAARSRRTQRLTPRPAWTG